jgi:hypothetical protein
MYDTISEYQFRDWFTANRPNNFSYDGLKALFNYLEEYEDSTGEKIEFDPIALCCEYTEYENIKEFNKNYDYDCKTLDDIRYYTEVIEIENSDSFIIQDF